MAFKVTIAPGYITLVLCLNFISFTLVSSQKGTCPIDELKLGVCANVLNLVKAKVGSPPTLPCCSLIKGLADLEAAACLCTALKANILGLHLDVPISLSVILNNCGRNNSAFECP